MLIILQSGILELLIPETIPQKKACKGCYKIKEYDRTDLPPPNGVVFFIYCIKLYNNKVS